MQNRMSLRLSQSMVRVAEETRLNAALKAVLQWADIDDHQVVLDADCVNESLLNHISRQHRVQSYGLLTQPDNHLTGSAYVHNAETLYASRLDLPWKDNKFDKALVTLPLRKGRETEQFIKELYRVLKPGGQLLIAVMQSPIARFLSAKFMKKSSGYVLDSAHDVMHILNNIGFVDSSARQCGFEYVCVIASKSENEIR